MMIRILDCIIILVPRNVIDDKPIINYSFFVLRDLSGSILFLYSSTT